MGDELAKGPLPIISVLRRALDLATALNQFHRQGHVHGRITPSLIAVTPAGMQLLESTAAAGTVTPYTAPEQLSGKVDARSDIFAFGAVIYELATGWKAFPVDTEAELRTKILEKEPAPFASVLPKSAGVPAYAALERLIANCLVKNPDQRRQRMQTVLVDLKLLVASASRAVASAAPAVTAPAVTAPAATAPAATAPPPPKAPVISLPPRSTAEIALKVEGVEQRPARPAPAAQAIPFQKTPVQAVPQVPEAAPLTVEPVLLRAETAHQVLEMPARTEPAERIAPAPHFAVEFEHDAPGVEARQPAAAKEPAALHVPAAPPPDPIPAKPTPIAPVSAPVVQATPGAVLDTHVGKAGSLELPPAQPAVEAASPATGQPSAAAYARTEPRIPVRTGMPFAVAEEITEPETPAADAAEVATPAPRPEPGIAERRAAMILSQVGFGEEPGYMNLPPKKKWGFKLKVRTTETQKSIWVSALKIAAVLVAVAVIGVVVLAASRLVVLAAHLHVPSLSFSKPTSPIGVRFALPAPEQASYMSSPAISPDGHLLAFSAVSPEKKRLLWIRPLNSLHATPLDGTDNALAPFWSPDSRTIGFFAGKKLKKIAVGGGAPTTLCDTDGLAGGGTWNREGVIVFGNSFYEALYRVSANGGTPQAVTKLDSSRGERAHLWPRFLPDGRHFVLYALSDPEDNNGVSIGSLDNKETKHLLSAETNAIYAEPASSSLVRRGYLLFARGRRLIAQPFDASTADLKGESFTVADDITYLGFINLLPISASDNGVLAYQNIDAPKRQLVWLDRDGNQTGTLGEPGEYGQARLSPDNRTVAVNRLTPGKDTADIYIFDVASNNATQLTSEATHEGSPIWSPDGKSLVYFSNPGGHFDLYRKPVSGGQQELLFSSGEDKYPTDWSPDGKYVLFGSMGAGTNSDLWLLPLKSDRKPFTYLQTVSAEGYGTFSPDGKWIAYQSDETGRAEVYVEQFPRVQGDTRRYQISTEGGGLPRWREDGKEVYYIMGNGKMMAVTVSAGAGFAISPPRLLFQTRALPRTWNLYDVTRDGRRFLVNTPLEWATSSPITVVANWTEGFKAQ